MVTAIAKADRLRREGKVRPVPARVFQVEGDHGTYLVTIAEEGETQTACTCPAPRACSHLLAATETMAGEWAHAISMDELWKRVGA